jgi:hypothetical protein
LAKAIAQRAQLAYEQILWLVPFFLEKYKDQLADGSRKTGSLEGDKLGVPVGTGVWMVTAGPRPAVEPVPPYFPTEG